MGIFIYIAAIIVFFMVKKHFNYQPISIINQMDSSSQGSVVNALQDRSFATIQTEKSEVQQQKTPLQEIKESLTAMRNQLRRIEVKIQRMENDIVQLNRQVYKLNYSVSLLWKSHNELKNYVISQFNTVRQEIFDIKSEQMKVRNHMFTFVSAFPLHFRILMVLKGAFF